MRRIFLKPTVLFLLTTILLSSCASIVSKTNYPVYIHSNPAGVTVSVTDKKGREVYNGRTPANVTLRTGSGYFAKAVYQVKLSSPGFNEKIVPINYKLNGWYFGNLLFGGVIGMLIVDPASGAMWKIANPVVDETLSPATSTTSGAIEPTLNIVDITSVSAKIKSQLVRIN